MSMSKACVPVYSADDQPSGSLVFGAVDSGLDTVWTRIGQGVAKNPRERGAMGGFRRPRTGVRGL